MEKSGKIRRDRGSGIFYKIMKFFIIQFLPRYKMVSKVEIVEGEAAIFVANHMQAVAPLVLGKSFPYPFEFWVAAGILSWKTAFNYIIDDFFVGKRNIITYIGAFCTMIPLVPFLKGKRPIPVYKDKRIVDTFGQSIECLIEGRNVIIFPECEEKAANFKFVYQFRSGYVKTGKYYYKQTGKKVKFYPMYVAAGLKTFNIGEPIEYNPENESRAERERINTYLMNSVEALGAELPPHKVIMYKPGDKFVP